MIQIPVAVLGVLFVAIAIVTFVAAKPLRRVVKQADKDFFEVVAMLIIFTAGVTGIFLTFLGAFTDY